jgi:hypothetical protein
VVSEYVFCFVPFFCREDGIDFCMSLTTISTFCLSLCVIEEGVINIPAAAILNAPPIPCTSSLVTKLGCAINPASNPPLFNHLHTYLPPKQYPTPPSLRTPISPRSHFITAAYIGSTVEGCGITAEIQWVKEKEGGMGKGTSVPANLKDVFE